MKLLLVLTFPIILALETAGQSGGTFEITRSVIASGGAQSSSGGIFAVDGTIAQPNVGTNPSGGNFSIIDGFWLPPFAPTAANVSIGGRVLTAFGIGIRNATVVLTSQGGITRSFVTSSFGYYRFDDVTVGETYFVTVSAKGVAFPLPTMVISVNEDLRDLDFLGTHQ